MSFDKYLSTTIGAILNRYALRSYGSMIKINGYRLRDKYTQNTFLSIERELTLQGQLIKTHLNSLLSITIPYSDGELLLRGEWSSDISHAQEIGKWGIDLSSTEDYTFNYPITTLRRPKSILEYGAILLSAIMDIADLGCNETKVCPDEITMRNIMYSKKILSFWNISDLGSRESSLRNNIEYQPLHTVAATEPKIVLLARHWALLSNLLNISVSGKQKIVDSFRLRNNEDWVVPLNSTVGSITQHLTRACTSSCSFCYLESNPDDIAIGKTDSPISEKEIITRLKYYDPNNKCSLFDSQWEYKEVFSDPKAEFILRNLRSKTPDTFFFVTNGNQIDSSYADLLVELKPIFLIVSINSIDVKARCTLMGETQLKSQRACHVPRLLSERKIPFGVSIFCGENTTQDTFEKTIYSLNDYAPCFIRVCHYGYTRFTPNARNYNYQQKWLSTIEWIKSIRNKVSIPIISIPSAFEESLEKDPNSPRILGTVLGSPAANSGLRPNDFVYRINHIKVRDRWQLQVLLYVCQKPMQIEIIREGKQLMITLDPQSSSSYPYCGHHYGKYCFPCGIVASPCISDMDIEPLCAAVKNNAINICWIITSDIMLPSVRKKIEFMPSDLQRKIHPIVVKNEYLGGNISVLDMATCDDIISEINQRLKNTPNPDIVFIPSSGFNYQGRDLTGHHWQDLCRLYSFKIELLEIKQIFTF